MWRGSNATATNPEEEREISAHLKRKLNYLLLMELDSAAAVAKLSTSAAVGKTASFHKCPRVITDRSQLVGWLVAFCLENLDARWKCSNSSLKSDLYKSREKRLVLSLFHFQKQRSTVHRNLDNFTLEPLILFILVLPTDIVGSVCRSAKLYWIYQSERKSKAKKRREKKRVARSMTEEWKERRSSQVHECKTDSELLLLCA